MSTVPHGAWPSPLGADALSGGSVRLGEVVLDGAVTYWTEGRADDGGRTTLLRRDANGTVTAVSPATDQGGTFDVRTRAQEYGGASFDARDGVVVASRKEDDRLYLLTPGVAPQPLTPADGTRYAAPTLDLPRGLVHAVAEDHDEPGGFRTDPDTTLVSIPLDGSAADDPAAVRTVFSGTDFVNAPRLSPDGGRLAFVTWNHPDMPWDASVVQVLALDGAGAPVGAPFAVAGGDGVSAQEPVWTEQGDLIHVDDRTGWWNLYRSELGEAAGPVVADAVRTRHLHPADCEFSAPQWAFGPRTIAVLDLDHLVVSWADGGRRLGTVRLSNGELEAWVGEWSPTGTIAATSDRVVFLGSHPRRPAALVELDLATGTTTTLVASSSVALDPGNISEAEPVSWTSTDGAQAHGFFYLPRLAGVNAPASELPPLLVIIHGGPTSATHPGLSLGVQYWTTRGFAVLDVDYGGSTGYGRAYRERLLGNWGVTDVADCASGAESLAQAGRVDPDRLAIRGGSAGGFTALAAVAFTDTFAAATSLYGIGDLAALAQHTHKFEAQYLDSLVGPYPGAASVYEERSPLVHVEQIDAPVLLLQGSEDRVVPQSQSDEMAQALRGRGVPVGYVVFDGEGHGFRGAEAIRRALELELSFYGQLFSFDPDGDVERLDLPLT